MFQERRTCRLLTGSGHMKLYGHRIFFSLASSGCIFNIGIDIKREREKKKRIKSGIFVRFIFVGHHGQKF